MHERHVGDSSVENRIMNGTAVLGSKAPRTRTLLLPAG